MIAKTKIKTGGVNTSDAAIIVYKNTKEELPLVGQEKILYLIIPTSELYIWTGSAYCKINGVLEETLSDLTEKFKNNSELFGTEFAILIEQINKLDKETQQKFIDTYAAIDIAASTQEELNKELNETLNVISKDIETYKEESKKELDDLAQALDAAESDLSNLNSNMTLFMSDGIFDTAEIAAIGQLYNQINQSFNSLNTEYIEVVNKIESIIESNKPEDTTGFINDEFPSLNTMKSIWKDPNKEVFINDNTISYFISEINNNKKSFSDFNLYSLFQFILELCLYITKDKQATTEEIKIWNQANSYLSEQLTNFEVALRSTTAAIALFDAEDEIQEALGSVNQTINGLQQQIDGQIINWNDKGFPLPLYDHMTNKWFNGSEWVDAVQTEHKGPSLNWVSKYDQHINDTYVDLTTGSAYRWCNTNVGYHWCKIVDTATEEVLRKASELEGALDGKTTTFMQQEPTHPYHRGDLWIVHKDYEGYKKGEILNCIRNSENQFNIEDWNRECAYVDQSKVNEAEANAKDYSDKNIQTNNQKQLINVNNLILYNKSPWSFGGSYGPTQQRLNLSEPLIPNQTYTFGATGALGASLYLFGEVIYMDGTNVTASSTSINPLNATYQYDDENNVSLYTFTVPERSDDKKDDHKKMNAIKIYWRPVKESNLIQPFLYQGNVNTNIWKPSSPVIDVNLLGQVLYKILNNWPSEEGPGFTEADIHNICFNVFKQY